MYSNTSSWLDRARAAIGQGYVTNSKNPETDFMGITSTHFVKGYGGKLIDHDNKHWIDLISGLGAIHFGYGNEIIESRVSKVAQSGGCLSGCSCQEVVTAEKIKSFLFWADRVKFVNDGSEACTAAIRMARSYNGRTTVCSEGYHGWSCEFTGLNDNCVGIPDCLREEVVKFDITNLDTIPKDAAAVILEPVMIDASKERRERLNRLREYCTTHKIVLIFDEVITGLRFDSGSVAAKWNIHPELICCGKAFGNGHKVGFVAGDKEILDGNYFVSGTYFGHIPSLKAIEACIDLSRESRYKSERLNEMSKVFADRFNDIAGEFVKIDAWGCRGNFVGDFETVCKFRQELSKCRVFTKGTVVLNHCSIDHAFELLEITKTIINRMKLGEVKMDCPLPVTPTAQRIRDAK